jgi:hypothetical protein
MELLILKPNPALDWNAIWNSCPLMIHEDDYIVIDCVLCGATMKNIHDTHNAHPLAPSQTAKKAKKRKKNIGRCCSKCDAKLVFPQRLANAMALRDAWLKQNQAA